MKTADLARAVPKDFLEDNTRPDYAFTGGRRGEVLDERRWDGRSVNSCLKQWNKMRNDCSAFHSSIKRIETVDLTGSPTELDIERCAVAL